MISQDRETAFGLGIQAHIAYFLVKQLITSNCNGFQAKFDVLLLQRKLVIVFLVNTIQHLRFLQPRRWIIISCQAISWTGKLVSLLKTINKHFFYYSCSLYKEKSVVRQQIVQSTLI